jgi:putative ABC transport system substrate-binding protein
LGVAKQAGAESGYADYRSSNEVIRPLLYFAVALGCALVANGVRAQQTGRVPVVGLLMVNAGPNESVVTAVRRGLRDIGYVDSQSIRIEYRGAQGREDRLLALAQELVQLKVDAIVVGAEASARAAKQATSTIPIVFAMYDVDPVAVGLIDTFSHPGANITGIFSRQSELVGKRLELLRELVPGLTHVAVLWDSFSRHQLDHTGPAAQALGIDLALVEMRPPYNFEKAFRTIKNRKPDALLVLFSPVFNTEQAKLSRLAVEGKLPTMFQDPDNVRAGGLIAYGPSREEVFGRTAYYIDRVLKGAKPSELPVEQSANFRLVVNLRTAKALGLVVPESILVRADEVIR